MSLFGNPSTTSSLFPSNAGGGLFGQPGGTPITTSPSLFSSITGGNPQGGGTGLFGGNSGAVPGQNSPFSGLTGANTGAGSSLFTPGASTSGTGLFSQNTGSLFGNSAGGTGLFNTNPAPASQPGLFGAAPAAQGSLFSGNFGSNSTGLFNTATSTPSLFSGNSFGQTGGLFSQPLNAGIGAVPQQTQPIVYNQHPGYKDKIIDTLTQQEKENLFKLKTMIDENDSHLQQSEKTLEKISKFKSDIKLRLLDLFTYARKVQVSEMRCKVSVEIVKKFQANLSLFVKDAIKIFDRCEQADSYHQIDSPGAFLSDMLVHCEERLKGIDESYKEIQELLLIEQKSSEFVLLVNTISMMQDKFEIISSIAYDVHKRVEEVVNRYANLFGINSEENSKKDVKMKETDKPKKFSTLSDIIAARPSAFKNFFH